MAKRQHLPDGIMPRCLDVDQAAAYVGMSGPTFERAVDAGLFPPALPLDRAGISRNIWDRHALDHALDRLSGIAATSTGTPTAARAQLEHAINGRKVALRNRTTQ